jgi:hypothetical protein
LSIIDVVGNVVMSDEIALKKGTTTVQQAVSRLAQGTYLARIQFENGSQILKKVVLY